MSEERIKIWKAEEKIAHIHGWDFSHIAARIISYIDAHFDGQVAACPWVGRSLWRSSPA